MKRVCLVVAFTSLLGCATTGGRVGAGVSGIAAGAVVVNQFRLLGCDDDEAECRDGVRNTGIVFAGIAVAALITAIVFELREPQRTSVP